MKPIPATLSFSAGPYRGYYGRAEFDPEEAAFCGQVVGTRDVITFAGTTFKETLAAFRDSVDDYLAFCRERGEPPEKPFSGKFVARIQPDLHRRASLLASAGGKSLNQFVQESLLSAVNAGAPVKRQKSSTTSKSKSSRQNNNARGNARA